MRLHGKARALYGPKADQKDHPSVLQYERNIFLEHSRRWRELREVHRQTRDFGVGRTTHRGTLNFWRTRRLLGPGLERNTVGLVVGRGTTHFRGTSTLIGVAEDAESEAWWRNPRSMSSVSADTLTGVKAFNKGFWVKQTQILRTLGTSVSKRRLSWDAAGQKGTEGRWV